jgi:arsenate reductase
MKEKGFELKNQYSKELKEFIGEKKFEFIITVCSKAEELCPTLPGVNERIFWDIEDPVVFEGEEEKKLEKFREVRDIIEEKIKELVNKQQSKE